MAVRQPAGYQAGTFSAVHLRAYGTLEWAQDPNIAGSPRPASGIIPRGAALDCAISQAGSTITVSPFAAVVAGNEAALQYGYLLINETAWSVAIPAPATSQRRLDRIVARVRDSAYSGSAADGDLVLVQGVAASSNPQLPAEPANCHTVATVDTTGSGTPVVTPTWRYTTVAGGIRPARGGSVDDLIAPRWPGEYRDLGGRLQRGSAAGGSWVDMASVAAFTEDTAPLYYEGTPGGGNGGVCSLGSGAVQTCRYQIFGKRAYLQYRFIVGSAPVSFGFGTVYSTLPSGVILRAGGDQHFAGKIRCQPSGNVTAYEDYLVLAYCEASSPNLLFRVTSSFTDNRLSYIRNSGQTNGGPNDGRPYINGGYPLSPGSRLEVQGWVELA